jgi:hypothetical protein
VTIQRSGVSSTVKAAKPTTEYGSPASLAIGSSLANAFVQFGLPQDFGKGATVVSAKLQLYQTGAWSAVSRTLNAQRAAAKWAVSTINWSNKPTVSGTAVPVTSSAAGAAGTLWEFDVSADVQAMANGTIKNYGWRISSTEASTRYVGGFSHASLKPTLDLVYTYLPATPTDLHPGAGLSISTAKPVLRWSPDDNLASFQIQIDPAANGTTPAFSSGVVVSSATEYDLNASSYAGLSNLASTQWRVKITDTSGHDSAWSDWVTFMRTNKPTLTITQPIATVAEPTPPIAWTMTGLNAWQVLVRHVETNTIVYDSGKRTGSTGAHTPNVNTFTVDGDHYTTIVQAYSNVPRDGIANDPIYVQASVTSVVAWDTTVNGADSLTVATVDEGPWPRLTFTRAAAPDGWAIFRDSVLIDSVDDASDWLSGGSYRYTDYTADAAMTHQYRAAPVVNGQVSDEGPSVSYTIYARGIWLVDPSKGLASSAVLWGDEAGDWDYGQDFNTYLPIGASAPVVVTTGMRGLEGSLSGIVTEVGSAVYTVDAVEARLFTLKASPAATVRLSVGGLNIPVILSELTLAPSPDTRVGDRFINVSFSYVQNGELPFAAVL